MSENLSTLLPIVGGLVILLILLNAIRHHFRKKRPSHIDALKDIDAPEEDESSFVLNEEAVEVEEKPVRISEKTEQEDLLVISLHAQKGKHFGDYMFLQALGAAGLVFGDHHIFHYDVKTEIGNVRLFSMARLNNPGTFDIDDIESVTCKGLLFFINLRTCKRSSLAIDCMLEVAQQLADDLDGILYEGYNIPWQTDTAQRLRSKAE
jgi:cell division protein ZipA